MLITCNRLTFVSITSAALLVDVEPPFDVLYLSMVSLNCVVVIARTVTVSFAAKVIVLPLATPSIIRLAPAVNEQAPAHIKTRSDPACVAAGKAVVVAVPVQSI